jgi:hypothetical protein
MKGTHAILGLAFAFVLVAAGGYPMLGGADQLTVAKAPPAPATAEPAPEEGACRADDPSGAALQVDELPMEAASCARCPDYAPSCYRDRDCDKVCGGKGTGAFIWFNSCVKCCACAL